MYQQITTLLKQQHADLDDLATEVQRKEITASRILRLMKIVQRNVEVCERIVALLDAAGLAREAQEEYSGTHVPVEKPASDGWNR